MFDNKRLVKQKIGIDIGSSFLTLYDSIDNKVKKIKHNGDIQKAMFQEINQYNNAYWTFTGKSGTGIADLFKGNYIDEIEAISNYIKRYYPINSNNYKVIDLGASSVTMYRIVDGKIIDIFQNTTCAFGTGIFLEKQALRLNINLYKYNLKENSLTNPPSIASRCTVFAKSDLIHHQQEGRTKDELWIGLCKSLVVSILNSLFLGKKPMGDILLIGGLARIRSIIYWFKELFPTVNWITNEHTQGLIAKGASICNGIAQKDLNLNYSEENKRSELRSMRSLILRKSNYPKIEIGKIDEFGNEVLIFNKIKRLQKIMLGLDIGSTSTKLAVLCGKTKEILLDIYTKTRGDPINSTKLVFKSFYKLIPEDIIISSFGTTGSGRLLIGKIFGADYIINEITAHAKGTLKFFPDINTIFEIGGQDAKYIQLKNGLVRDVNLNYICAAGTGSFVEEQALKLNIKIDEIGKLSEGIQPPESSDRCTVFMQQDIYQLQRYGFNKNELIGSVLYSVVKNYLSRVVGNRKIDINRICFQGATARNRGLVAAFENLLNREIVVSEHCHLMGAIGSAILANENIIKDNKESNFINQRATEINIQIREEVCKLCNNSCRINFISKNGKDQSSFGYQCGREPDSGKYKLNEEYYLFDKEREFKRFVYNGIVSPQKTLFLNKSLTSLTYSVLWKMFFSKLGLRLIDSAVQTNNKLRDKANEVSSGDYCFPLKVSLAHGINTLQKNKILFSPTMIAEKKTIKNTISYFCPYVQGNNAIFESIIRRSNINNYKLIQPVIDFRESIKSTSLNLYNSLKRYYNFTKENVFKAFKEAVSFFEESEKKRIKKGTQYLEDKIKQDEITFLILGRPYILYDNGLNLKIPRKFSEMGYSVIPMDMVKTDIKEIEKGEYNNLYWNYAQKILSTLKIIKNNKKIFPVFLSNFNCGPDSFLLNYIEKEIEQKPLLILKIDELNSDGGYQTRIEAFIDVVKFYLEKDNKRGTIKKPEVLKKVNNKKQEMIWIPPMHKITSRIFASAFKGYGYNARALNEENEQSIITARRYLRGDECLPVFSTLGSFINMLKNEDSQKYNNILFMPTAEGPCRFGQYAKIQEIVLNNLNMDFSFISPSSQNGYAGLKSGLRKQLLHAILASDILHKMNMKIRPYTKHPQALDDLIRMGILSLEKAFEKRGNIISEIRKIAKNISKLGVYKIKKPLIGIVGEIYVRCNSITNDNLIKSIEENGGEAWLTPVYEWIFYINYINGLNKKIRVLDKMLEIFYKKVKKEYYKASDLILKDRIEPDILKIIHSGKGYLPIELEGEAILTVGRALEFINQGVDMVINVSPFGCMAGNISSSLLLEINEKIKKPIISLFYDGQRGINKKIESIISTL